MRIQLIVLTFLFTFASIAGAAIVDGLYESEIPVANQTGKERKGAMATALAEVFAKVSGQPGAVNNPGIVQALAKPSLYVQQYRYRKMPDSKSARTAPATGQLIWFRFDESAVNKALRDNSIAVWGKTRPATLVWLAVEADGGRYLLGGESLLDLQNILERESKRYGVKVIVPLLDLQDQIALKFADVWGNFQEAIVNASQRYQSDAILVGKVTLSNEDEWDAQWVLYSNGQGSTWGAQSILPDDVISSGIIGTLEILAGEFNQDFAGGDTGELTLTIVDVNSLSGFARISRYLDSLEQVTNFKPSQIEDNNVNFVVSVRGSSQGLAQTIALGNTLRKVEPIMDLTTGEQPIISTGNTYRLLP